MFGNINGGFVYGGIRWFVYTWGVFRLEGIFFIGEYVVGFLYLYLYLVRVVRSDCENSDLVILNERM